MELGPTHTGALALFLCVCRGVICQAVVAEVEPLRLEGYDPRSALCMCGDPPQAQAIIDLSPKEWASRQRQGTTKASSAYFR